jgi:hypothetical protein
MQCRQLSVVRCISGRIHPFPATPHELSALRRCRLVIIPTWLVHSVADDARTSPGPQASRTEAGRVAPSALCVAKGLPRAGDGLGRPIYLLGSGLSWNPIAAAFRSNTFNTLAFILASYSSIDWVTYSSPCLSIL